MASIKVLRGQVWEVNFEPQTHKEEPGKRNRLALVSHSFTQDGFEILTTDPNSTRVKNTLA